MRRETNPLRIKAAEEALTWIGTPRIKGGRVKGAGCDCVTILAEVMISAGVFGREEVDAMFNHVGFCSDDWFHHTEDQKYLRALMRFAKLVMITRCFGQKEARPGDLVMTKCVGSSQWNHGGIVIEWPRIVHAVFPRVTECDATRDPMWRGHEIAIFSPIAYGDSGC